MGLSGVWMLRRVVYSRNGLSYATVVLDVCRWLAGGRTPSVTGIYGRRSNSFWNYSHERETASSPGSFSDARHRSRSTSNGWFPHASCWRAGGCRRGMDCGLTNRLRTRPSIEFNCPGDACGCAGNDRSRSMVFRCLAIRQKTHQAHR